MKTLKKFIGMPALFCVLFLLYQCTGTEKKDVNTLTDSTSTSRSVNDTLFTDDCNRDSCGACDNARRYPSPTDGGGKEIKPDEGKAMIESFQRDHGGILKGAFISKIALDSIFCHHRDFNGIFCYIAQDESGAQTFVFEGFAIGGTGANNVKVQFDNTLAIDMRYRVFSAQSMCPSDCGYCGD